MAPRSGGGFDVETGHGDAIVQVVDRVLQTIDESVQYAERPIVLRVALKRII